MRFLTALCCLLLLSGAFAADLYAASFTGPVTLQLPVLGQAQPRVFWRAGGGRWQPAQYEAQDGRLLFRLDPAKLGSGDVMLLVDPPAGVVLDDFVGPKLTGLKIDGKPQKTTDMLDLGNLGTAPKSLVAALQDAENTLQPGSWQVTFDRAAFAGDVKAEGDQRQVRLSLTFPQMEYGSHELVVSATDTSPQRNTSRHVIRFTYLDSGNLALASLGATVRVSSSFGGYESLAPINDGVSALSGTSCGNDVTWASLEVPTDHWAEVTLPRPTPLKEVSVYWAAYTDVAHTPRHFQIQVPEGEGWKAIYTSPADGEKESRVTTARFAPVTVSKFRVFMPAGKGSATRPNLLWIAEIKAR